MLNLNLQSKSKIKFLNCKRRSWKKNWQNLTSLRTLVNFCTYSFVLMWKLITFYPTFAFLLSIYRIPVYRIANIHTYVYLMDIACTCLDIWHTTYKCKRKYECLHLRLCTYEDMYCVLSHSGLPHGPHFPYGPPGLSTPTNIQY